MTGALVVYLALLLPWVTHWRFAGQSTFAAVQGTPLLLFAIGALAIFGADLARRHDRWLGVFVVYTALQCLWTPLDVQPLHVAALVAAGAWGIVQVRQLPAWVKSWTAGALVALGVAQSLLMAGQALGVDFYWPGGPHLAKRLYGGTFGASSWAGAFLAIVAPLGGWWGVLLVPGLVLSKSATGMLALGLAAAVVVRRRLVLIALAVLVALPAAGGHLTDRLSVWGLGLSDYAHGGWGVHLWGYGPGSWAYRVPELQAALTPMGLREGLYLQAHNEPLQVLYEGGLVGLALLALWCWSQRAAFGQGAFVALGVVSLFMFPFRVPHVAASVVVVLGLVTSRHSAGGVTMGGFASPGEEMNSRMPMTPATTIHAKSNMRAS